jgi:hypothetical protein
MVCYHLIDRLNRLIRIVSSDSVPLLKDMGIEIDWAAKVEL